MSVRAVSRDVVVLGMSAASVFLLADEWCRRCGAPCSYAQQTRPRILRVSCGRCGYTRVEEHRSRGKLPPKVSVTEGFPLAVS